MRKIRFEYTGVKAKLMFAYIFLAIIPIFLITSFSNVFYLKIIQDQLDTLLEYSMNQAGTIISENIKVYEGILYNIIFDRDILYYSQKIEEKDNVPVNKYFMIQELMTYANSNEDIRSILFISNSFDYALYEKDNFVTHESYFYDEDIRKSFLELSDKQGITFISTRNLKRKIDDLFLYFLAMPIKDYITNKEYGFIYLGIRESTLNTLTVPEEQLNNVNVHRVLSSKNIIIDEDGVIVSHQDKKYLGEELSIYLQNEINSNLFLKRMSIPDTPWELVNIIDKGVIYKNMKNYELLVFFISLIITLIFFTIIAIISRQYLNSIQEIANGVRAFGKGQMDVKIEFEEKDELFTIAYQFNKMANRINNLVKTLEKQKNDIRIAVEQKRRSEIKALEAQINPHFIYNTLDMINWIAIENKQEMISEMLSRLGGLLRYSFSNIYTMVLLEEEIEWIKKYIALQKMRFHNSFDCIYDITEEALKFPIYKLLLQPIVENAIIHGFEGIKSGGLIEISAFVNEDNMLVIEICDNGCGIDEDVLVKIKEYINDDSLFNGDNIGFSNVVNRIRLYYSGEADIEIDSKKGSGTRVSLKLPYKEEEKQ